MSQASKQEEGIETDENAAAAGDAKIARCMPYTLTTRAIQGHILVRTSKQ